MPTVWNSEATGETLGDRSAGGRRRDGIFIFLPLVARLYRAQPISLDGF